MFRSHVFKNFFFLTLLSLSFAWFYDHEKIKLEEVKAITLHKGQWSTGRRNPAVPQLKCVGGSAASTAHTPNVVQCRNVGSDGFDAQWECKADMDDSYIFGRIQVSCEGYDHPNDPYILKGSCGLEYTLNYIESGQRQSPNTYRNDSKSCWRGFWWKLLFVLALVGFIIFKTNLKTVIKNQVFRRFQSSATDFRSGRPDLHATPNQRYNCPEVQNDDPPSYDDATSTAGINEATNVSESRRSGFWNGFSWGGLLGYFFGSRSNTWYPFGEYSRAYNSGYHSGWSTAWGPRTWGSRCGSGSSWLSGTSWFVNSPSTRSSSCSSRTTVGFGGTTRR